MTSSTHDQKWTYTSLRQALAQRDILLRVHTSPTSPLPKGNNDSDPSTSGFTARNAAFKGLSPAQFKVATARLRMEEGWAEGPYMRKVIIDHINNTTTVRSRVTPPRFARPFGQGRLAHVQRRDPIPARFERFEADEQSPWISTTEKLDWAIWYISKLLSQGHKTVHLAIIRNGARNGEISVMPFRNRLGLNQGRDPLLAGLEGAEREAYRRARSNSIVSNEILLYGRIFGESILADMTFTSHELPFGLPLHFWNPIEHIDRSRQGWLARLRYHPMLLNFGMAMENINRPPAPRGSWSMQPVNHELQVHASALKSGPPISTLTLADRPVESAGVPQNQKLKNEAKVEERDEEESEDGSEIGEDEDEDEDEVNLVLEGLLVDLTIPDHLKK